MSLTRNFASGTLRVFSDRVIFSGVAYRVAKMLSRRGRKDAKTQRRENVCVCPALLLPTAFSYFSFKYYHWHSEPLSPKATALYDFTSHPLQAFYNISTFTSYLQLKNTSPSSFVITS